MNAFVIGLALLGVPSAASAANFGGPETPPFDVTALDDDMLAGVTGRAGAIPLSTAAMKRIVDDNGRSDLRQSGSVGRIQMDVWWGTIGSELIAQNVRAAHIR